MSRAFGRHRRAARPSHRARPVPLRLGMSAHHAVGHHGRVPIEMIDENGEAVRGLDSGFFARLRRRSENGAELNATPGETPRAHGLRSSGNGSSAFDTESTRSPTCVLIDYRRRPICATSALPVVRVPNATGDKAAIHALIGPRGRWRCSCLSGHTDCVPVEGQSWASDPFAAAARRRQIVRARHLRHERLRCLRVSRACR